MHKRLISNRADGLSSFDVEFKAESAPFIGDSLNTDEYFQLSTPLSNFAKSGTTDDIIRPFNVDKSSKKRTNYGLWNAVIRIDLSKLAGKSDTVEPVDLTVACIGEGNVKYTGARDGKTLHKFLTAGLLKKAGIPVKRGYFNRYEQYIRQITPETENCGMIERPDSSAVPAVGNEVGPIQSQDSGWSVGTW
jgi:hypothetical protein